MKSHPYRWLVFVAYLVAVALFPAGGVAQNGSSDRKAEYINAVTQGAGFMPWQERGVSDAENVFRRSIEQRKDELLAARVPVERPVLLTKENFAQARRNIAAADWARQWYEEQKTVADYVLAQPDKYIDDMIPELTPTHAYGFTCPNCLGTKSQEGVGHSLIKWDYRNPDVLSCAKCGHVYPSEKYPETARLEAPRSGQTFTYYLNERERANPEDRSGRHAWHWVGYPMHFSFTGIIRQEKIKFMISAVRALAVVYSLDGDVRHAEKAQKILLRLAHCYPRWLYHDYWDTIADCDPMYAAWHDRDLPLEWKRHLCGQAFAKDSPDRAAMLQNYWGAGRIHPSTDSINLLTPLAQAYDQVCEAGADGDRPTWSAEERAKVERDLILEYIMGAEPFLGGANQAKCVNNKSPRIYHAMAAVAQCLGLPMMADTALRGYEGVRDQSFLYDGFSRESPAYTNMYLSELVYIPEMLHGFQWPADFPGRQGITDIYRTDNRLRLMFRSVIDQLRPDGLYPPLSDTSVLSRPGTGLLEIGQKRYPEYFSGKLPMASGEHAPSAYAFFHLEVEQARKDEGFNPPEIYYPAWMTAFLRHGRGADASMLALSFAPPGGHRHRDNLSLFYFDGGQTILGDQGYLGDMPQNRWIQGTQSHNLVVVDNAEQKMPSRKPSLSFMVTSPRVSVVEASSQAYTQCREYRRLVALIKGPRSQTFAVDIFRVQGGERHDYRLFSELASSDMAEGRLAFTGIDMPQEPPLPQFGTSLEREAIFGLRDIRGVNDPPAVWQATWTQPDRAYRLWALGPAHCVEASNGPGQETLNQPGRRVRYLDVIRQGHNLESTFVAVHEPSGPNARMPIHRVERLDVPAEAGTEAVALRIVSDWGTYLLLSEFTHPVDVAGVRFSGKWGLVQQTSQGKKWILCIGAETCMVEGLGYEKATPSWSGRIVEHDDSRLTTDTAMPADWPPLPQELTVYVGVNAEGFWTGFPVRAVESRSIEVERFPLPPSTEFRIPFVRILGE